MELKNPVKEEDPIISEQEKQSLITSENNHQSQIEKRETEFFDEQNRIAEAHQRQQQENRRKIQRDVDYNLNHSDFLSGFGVEDADD